MNTIIARRFDLHADLSEQLATQCEARGQIGRAIHCKLNAIFFRQLASEERRAA